MNSWVFSSSFSCELIRSSCFFPFINLLFHLPTYPHQHQSQAPLLPSPLLLKTDSPACADAVSYHRFQPVTPPSASESTLHDRSPPISSSAVSVPRAVSPRTVEPGICALAQLACRFPGLKVGGRGRTAMASSISNDHSEKSSVKCLNASKEVYEQRTSMEVSELALSQC